MGMALLRFSRDKRGYEHFYLVQPSDRRGKSRARILYWFRTPPNVRVGREPFDLAIRRTLESQYPDVSFDWRKYVDTPIPRAEPEAWRERRDAARAAEAAARAGATGDTSEPQPEEMTTNAGLLVESEVVVPESAELGEPETHVTATPGVPSDVRPSGRGRRRRRGRRGGRPPSNLATDPRPAPERPQPEEAPEPVAPRDPDV
jgi:hypothetical protein